MLPQEELDRALARWKARKLGHEVAHDTAVPEPVDQRAPAHDEPTRVASAHYHSDMETPPAEVHLGEDDFEDHTHHRR
jgi:hypothetical protein